MQLPNTYHTYHFLTITSFQTYRSYTKMQKTVVDITGR